MRKLRTFLFLLLLTVTALALLATLGGFDWFRGAATGAKALAVSAGHAEIAFLMPATSGDTWERLVAAAVSLEKEWPTLKRGPALHVDKDRAFVKWTADVAELGLWLEGAENAKLWIRWYKLSSEFDEKKWLQALIGRGVAPLTVVGGDTTERALTLATALKTNRSEWVGPAPLLLMTTATADRFQGDQPAGSNPNDSWPKLIEVYNQRSFRLSFTNKRMAQVVLDFVRQHRDLWQRTPRRTALFGGGLMASQGWGFPTLPATVEYLRSPLLLTQAWADDPYSIDLADRFRELFPEALGAWQGENTNIEYSTGDVFNPNPSEAFVVTEYLRNGGPFRDQRQLLVLPTAAMRAQRFLRTLARRSPTKLRNFVVVNGDAISFNNIYRDRNTAWNIQDVPVPLIFFAHRNPIDPGVGFSRGELDQTEERCTATDDLLLHRDLLEVMVLGAFQGGQLVADADKLLAHLRLMNWKEGRIALEPESATNRMLLFHPSGDRAHLTGEHVVLLRPTPNVSGELDRATITVSFLEADKTWQAVGQPPRAQEGARALGLLAGPFEGGPYLTAAAVIAGRMGDQLHVDYDRRLHPREAD